MAVDPKVIRSEPHAEVGDILQRNVGIVIERWARRAMEEQPNAQRVHHNVLLNQMPDFLLKLGQSLAESGNSDACKHCLPAIIRGEQRWDTGWSLPEVVRDFQILRLVVLEFLEESLDRPVGYREVLAIGLALDEAIAASVAMFVQGRDEHLCQLEEKRVMEAREVQKLFQEQAVALKEADRRKNEFLAMLAHELRNPLAPIRNVAHILTLVPGPTDADLQLAREVIERQVQHMTRMVDDLLDVSRITLGKIKVEKEPVEATMVVARAIEMARPLIDSRRHTLNVTLPPHGVRLDADPARLAQVLTNLLTNAAKYMEEGGQIWLTVEVQKDVVLFKVRDAGVGIPENFLPRVFDLFSQEDPSMKRTQGGLGIGLTLVRTLVEMQGGSVQAFSAGPGQGSEFVARLPLLKEPPSPTPPALTKPQKHPKVFGRQVLIVDDDRDAARILSLLLRRLGHEVYTAHDGPAALETARSQSPDVILLDIGLPGMDGLEVARRMRQELEIKAMLVALTGYGQDDNRRRSEESGFNAYLVKPVELAELQSLLSLSPAGALSQPGQ